MSRLMRPCAVRCLSVVMLFDFTRDNICQRLDAMGLDNRSSTHGMADDADQAFACRLCYVLEFRMGDLLVGLVENLEQDEHAAVLHQEMTSALIFSKMADRTRGLNC